ncbi:class I SAM-dependent methyltransferase [Corynebacterium pyruviciproducens]|uniref:class I SAM-dependent DNA methyltransferase n=1 Tax=Corynebacterium pyruviciproducens TaxID=598660 RepID=UPI00254FDA2C|nr:class I SAM-dependent methyltransferase [Corynebacterium pyruviciproducens]MDK6566655.1 class I SAM-dependent methyltransferase [Corynebacterium pyruviciproducens]
MPTWKEITDRNPQHSANYAQRWDRIAAEGKDIFGEARLVDALVDRKSRILDAGCGQGRIGGYLAQRGHTVTGVDIDPYLIGIARSRHPEARWQVGDLVGEGLPRGPFDAIVSTGNVLTFLEPGTQVTAWSNLAAVLAPGGRIAAGFGLDRGYSLEQCQADIEEAGLTTSLLLSSWDIRPFTRGESTFAVVIAQRAGHDRPRAKTATIDLGRLRKL